MDTLTYQGAATLVDTAGIRRKGRVSQGADSLAMAARRAIERADVVVLVLDATEPFAAQDAHIAGYAMEARKPVVAVNKWDLVERREEAAAAWQEELRRRLRFVKEVRSSSSPPGRASVLKVLDQADAVHAAGGRRVPTRPSSTVASCAGPGRAHSPAGGHSVRLFYAAQTGAPAPLRPLLQRRAPRPFLAEASAREQPARAFRVRCGPPSLAIPQSSRAGAGLTGALRLAWHALRNFWHDGCPNFAAMVAFWAVLGLGPLGLPGGFSLLGGLSLADRTALQQVAAYLLREAEPFVDDLAKSLLQGRVLVVFALPGLVWIASGAFRPRVRDQRGLRHRPPSPVLARPGRRPSWGRVAAVGGVLAASRSRITWRP